MEKAVIYARYSSHSQTEQSIEGQLAAAYKYASEKGYTVISEYCDRAKTGTNDNREAFQKMLRDTQKHAFTVIIVWKVDRFGRNREEITFNKHKCKRNGVRVEYVAENITDGPEGVILESVLEGMAEYYSLQLSQNVKRGQLEAAKKHKVISGRVPYGYKVGEDGTYAIDEATATNVRIIFNMYTTGSSIREIEKWLNAHGIVNRTGNPFTKSTLSSLLNNERYIGVYTFKDVIREEDVIPPIVSKAVFNRCQMLMGHHRRAPSHRWSYSNYLLTGKVFCARCGSPMVGESGSNTYRKKYTYYKCLANKRGHSCKFKAVPQNDLEALVIEKTMAAIRGYDVLLSVALYEYGKRSAAIEDENCLESKLKNTEAAIANLVSSVEQGMPYERVKSRLAQLDQEAHTLSQQISEKRLSERSITKAHAEYFLKRFIGLDWTNLKAQQNIISLLVNRIEVDDQELKIALNLTEDGRPLEKIRMCPGEQTYPNAGRTFIQDNTLVIVSSTVLDDVD